MGLVAFVALQYSVYEVGLNGLLWSVAVMSRTAGCMGLDAMGMKEQTPLWAEGREDEATAFARRDLFVLGRWWALLLIGVTAAAVVADLVFTFNGWWIVALGVVACTSAFQSLFTAQRLARNQPLLAQFIGGVAAPGLALLGAWVCHRLAPEQLITSQVVSFALVAGVMYLVSPSVKARIRPSREPVKWRTTLTLATGSTLTALAVRAPIFFLGGQSLAAAGTYEVAQRVQAAGALGTSAVATVYIPRITAELHRARQLVRLIWQAAGMSLSIPLGLLAFLLFVREEGVIAVLGPDFSGAWAASVLLVISTIINASTSAMSNVLMFADRERLFTGASLVQLLVVGIGTLISGADTAPEMAVWVIVGELFRSGAMITGFLLHLRTLRVEEEECPSERHWARRS